MKQSQFLEVLDRDEAERRWRAVVASAPLAAEEVPLEVALGRVLAEDVRAAVDVPGFDRANMDGFAVRSEDTFGASELEPRRLAINPESIPTGVFPALEVRPGTATPIATGGMLPRGADAVVPVEVTQIGDDDPRIVEVRAARVPGAAVSFAGTDMGRGETVLFAGTRLTSRETGLLAAIGRARVRVHRRPRVAVISTGDEIVQPGAPMRPGLVYDSNGRILVDACRELGAEAEFLGSFRDDPTALRAALRSALEGFELVLLSGGTSKGEGDLNATIVGELSPGILVHGVALKPGKPICLAAHGTLPVVILPGFPTSAIFTFHEFVAPLIRALAGVAGAAQVPPVDDVLGDPSQSERLREARPAAPLADRRETRPARLAQKTRSDRGRLEYLLVGLVPDASGGLAAYPMGKGSGSVTTFSRADGFVRIGRNVEIVDADTPVEVTLIGREVPVADLVVIGSHCAGLDLIASGLGREGFRVKLLAVGSQGGLDAARRGECDVAPIHLLDPETGRYNERFLERGMRLVPGYTRMQGVVTRAEEGRAIEALLGDPAVRMVNRNRGAGTRILIDRLLAGRTPPGYAYEPRSHYAVAAAVAQGRADWGVTIETIAREAGLRFQPLQAEHYDFVVPEARAARPAVKRFVALLEDSDSALRRALADAGFARA